LKWWNVGLVGGFVIAAMASVKIVSAFIRGVATGVGLVDALKLIVTVFGMGPDFLQLLVVGTWPNSRHRQASLATSESRQQQHEHHNRPADLKDGVYGHARDQACVKRAGIPVAPTGQVERGHGSPYDADEHAGDRERDVEAGRPDTSSNRRSRRIINRFQSVSVKGVCGSIQSRRKRSTGGRGRFVVDYFVQSAMIGMV
jgi:hypothetical protein